VQPDVLHGHSFHANIVARLLKILNRGPLVVSTVHNVYEGGLHRMVLYRLTDLLCVRTTAVSEAARARFVRMRAVPKDKCVVVTNGIDTEEFAPDADRRVQMRAHMGVAGEFVWLTAGRLVPAKDLPNLLRAFAQVWVAMPDAKLWIAGNGDVEAVRRASGLDPDSGTATRCGGFDGWSGWICAGFSLGGDAAGFGRGDGHGEAGGGDGCRRGA
jgi:glycosyltransferase involved in cell wall biosynthesis